ncbi:MAG: manganese efflux pump MntP family protein [Acidobacteriales bacterium]|nr:manganese efflux pump MntP family protein [Terriglobales bacterium]
MGWISLLALACALAMDAFAVAIVTGLTLNPLTPRQVFRLAFHFGLFQALMPMLGWLAGTIVQKYISTLDHWIAFGLLAFVGGRMIWGALHDQESGRRTLIDPTTGWSLVVLSVATSIDALAVGLSLAFLGSTIFVPALVIGIVAASFTSVGMVIGRRVGSIWGERVTVLGGLILIGIGIKIVIEHLSA